MDATAADLDEEEHVKTAEPSRLAGSSFSFRPTGERGADWD